MYFFLIFNKSAAFIWNTSQFKELISSLTDRLQTAVDRIISDEIDRYIKELMNINRVSEQETVTANIDQALREKLGLDIEQINA